MIDSFHSAGNQHLINFIFVYKFGSNESVSIVVKAETEYIICKDNHNFTHFNIFHNKNYDKPLLSIS
jgi:ADP-dependent phosphofructokinase/glucokinase